MTKEEVISSVNSISPDNISGDLKKEFCKAWPAVKEGLQILEKIVPAPFKVIIGLVITGGDALSKKICG